MRKIKSGFSGWKIVYFSVLIIGTIFAILLFFNGINEASIRLVIRATARNSCLLFIAAFIASSLHIIWPGKISKWLVKNRRYLGISVAVSHTYHAIAIICLLIITSGAAYKSDPGGTLGYLFLIAMTVTSFDRTANLIGKTAWKILHTVGMYYLWLSFTYVFFLRLEESMFIYLPFFSLLILAIIIRFTNLIIKNKLRISSAK